MVHGLTSDVIPTSVELERSATISTYPEAVSQKNYVSTPVLRSTTNTPGWSTEENVGVIILLTEEMVRLHPAVTWHATVLFPISDATDFKALRLSSAVVRGDYPCSQIRVTRQ